MSSASSNNGKGDESGADSSSNSPAAPAAESSGDAERKQITGRAGIVAAGTLFSRLLGLGRDQVLAAVFTRAETDVFFIAFVLPNVLRQLLAEGAVQTAVLPVLAETREKQGEEEARRFFRAIRGLSLSALVLVTVLGVVGAPLLVELWAPGYKDIPGQFERTVELSRWLFPYILCMGTAALGVAALNTYKRFVVTSFAPALLNVAFIACAAVLPGVLGAQGMEQVYALAFGALIGGVLQVVAQWPSLKAIGYFQRPSFDFKHPGVREVLRRMGPVLIGLGVYYVDVLLARRFLSELEVGSQSYFNYALRLTDFPQGIFVMALQSATLPSLAALWARGEKEEVEKTLAYGLRLSLFVGFAATAGIVALAEPIVVLIFQRGEFDAVASRETGKALMALGLHIWMVAAVRQLVATYYAIGDTKTPVLVAGVDLVAFVVLALLLRGPFGHVGICLAVVGSSGVQLVLLWVLLKRRLDNLRLGEVLGSGVRSLVAAAVAAGAGWATAGAISEQVGVDWFSRLLPGLGGALVFGATFLAAARVVRSPELEVVGGGLWRKLRRRAS